MKDYVRARVDLHDYPMLDTRNHNLWRLRSGYRATLPQAIRAEQDSRRVLGVEHLCGEALKLHVHPDDVNLFKGPELDKSHSGLRILTRGDSCIFRTGFDKHSYSREVVHGGVQGYYTRQVLERVEEFKALRPDITFKQR